MLRRLRPRPENLHHHNHQEAYSRLVNLILKRVKIITTRSKHAHVPPCPAPARRGRRQSLACRGRCGSDRAAAAGEGGVNALELHRQAP